MSDTSIVPRSNDADAERIELALIASDLSKLSPTERVMYYKRVCTSLGLNEFTQPFRYITLNGRLTLYATRDATDQLRKIHGINIEIVSRELLSEAGVYVVTARATDRNGRTDESIGAVPVTNVRGEAYANAIMKAETKAKRRVTLSIAGLGWLDESETQAVPGAQPMPVDVTTGELVDNEPPTLPPMQEPVDQLPPDGDDVKAIWSSLPGIMRENGLVASDLAKILPDGRFTMNALEQWLHEHPGVHIGYLIEEAKARKGTT